MDGPFAETKEALGGFYLIECDTRQEAVEWAKKIPLHERGFVETTALRAYHLLPAVRADFLRRLGRWTEAATEYRVALRLVDNKRERTFLTARLAVCETGGGDL